MVGHCATGMVLPEQAGLASSKAHAITPILVYLNDRHRPPCVAKTTILGVSELFVPQIAATAARPTLPQ
jgi:hypothetical protein